MGAVAADVGESIDVVAQHRRAGGGDLLPLPQGVKAIVQNRQRQADVVGDRAAALGADAGEKLEDQVLDQRFAQPGVFGGRRFLGLKGVVEAEGRNQGGGVFECIRRGHRHVINSFYHSKHQ